MSDITFSAVTFLIGCLVGALFSFAIMSDLWRQDVVDRGFAEWQIIKGTRELEFKWKDEP